MRHGYLRPAPKRLTGALLFAPLLGATIIARLFAFPFVLDRIDDLEDWRSIALEASGIKYVVPGPRSTPGPDGELVPGAEELPCLDFVLYGPGIQHIDIIRAAELECVENFTAVEMNRLRESMAQFAGYIARFPDSEGQGRLCGVTIHNDMFSGPPVISPENVRYVMRQIRLTFNEEALGRLVYLPTMSVAKERAKAWILDPSVELDFEVYLEDPGAERGFLRGDATGDGVLTISDPVAVLLWLFVDRGQRPVCLDAADANDDGALDLHDPMRTLRYLFLEGEPPSPPFPSVGPDPTGDELGDC